MLSPRPRVSVLPIGGDSPCVVVDDALIAPQDLVDLALRHRAAFDAPRHNAYPGIELPLPEEMVGRFTEHLALHARRHLPARRVLQAHGRLAMVTVPPSALSPVQRVCHRDRLATSTAECAIAAVLYLFHDVQLGGTSFFTPRQSPAQTDALMDSLTGEHAEAQARTMDLPPGYMVSDHPLFSLAAAVPPRWNRLIYYDGGRFHNSHIARPDLLNDDPASGRLTLNLFFRCSRKAA